MSETITFETYWVGGKGAFKRASNLTTAVEEALHTFAYATMPGAGGGEGPGQIYGHLGSLYVGTGNLRQALEQMAVQITSMGQEDRMYHADGDSVPESAAATVDALLRAAAGAGQLTELLKQAQNAIAPLGTNNDDDNPIYEDEG